MYGLYFYSHTLQWLLSEEQKQYQKDIWSTRHDDTFSDRSPTLGLFPQATCLIQRGNTTLDRTFYRTTKEPQ